MTSPRNQRNFIFDYEYFKESRKVPLKPSEYLLSCLETNSQSMETLLRKYEIRLTGTFGVIKEGSNMLKNIKH